MGNNRFGAEKKVGFTCSCFDLLHAGHILMLEDAKKQCDYLIVGLQTDPTLDRPEKNKPIQSIAERYIQLEAVKYVDEIQIYSTESELRDILVDIWPDVRILGSDYMTKDDFTGCQYNIPIYYHERDHDYSSSDLRKKILEKA
jgi:glycerol-3-phosphate cytidylyltransferase